MSASRHTGRSYRELVEADIEMLPLMNLFIVLIPMLLLSAVFVEVSVIDMAMPQDSAAEAPPETEPFRLSVEITDGGFVIDGNRVDRAEVTDTDALRAALGAIADAHPENEAVQILSHPGTRYADIISVMDVSRESGMPQVALGDAEQAEG